MASVTTKLTEESVRETLTAILIENREEDVKAVNVKLPKNKERCLVVTVEGLMSIQSLAAIGEAYGDKSISVDGGLERYQTDIYIIINK